jgi:hypothetical protein
VTGAAGGVEVAGAAAAAADVVDAAAEFVVADAAAVLTLWLESPPQADSASAQRHAIIASNPRRKTRAIIPLMCASPRDAFQHFIRPPVRAQLSLNEHVVMRRQVTQFTGHRGELAQRSGAQIGVEDRPLFSGGSLTRSRVVCGACAHGI